MANGVTLYLDFDGVLHHDDVFWSRKVGIHMRAPGHALFEWMPILEDILRPYDNVRIVLSTTWVRVKSFEFAKKQLSGALAARVDGATFHRREMSRFHFENLSRGAQILADVSRRNPDHWLAIDNDDMDWPVEFRDNLIKTQDHLGLSEPAVQLALRERLSALLS